MTRKRLKSRDLDTPRFVKGDHLDCHLGRQWCEKLEEAAISQPNPAANLGPIYFNSNNNADNPTIQADITAGTGSFGPFTGAIEDSGNTQEITGTFKLTFNSAHDLTVSTSSASASLASGLATYSLGTSENWDVNDGTTGTKGLTGSGGSVACSQFSSVSLPVGGIAWNPGTTNLSITATGSVTAGSGQLSGTFGIGS